jgi:broad specificity phosphatase PhoE
MSDRPVRLAHTHPGHGSTTLVLVRHGRTRGNTAMELHGRTDLPLDEHGVAQADLVAERIGAVIRADALLTSPLHRARATAESIGRRIGLTPRIMPGLVEMDFGEFEGLTLEHVAIEHPGLTTRFLDLDDHDVGWPGGETRRVFHARVRDAFDAILDEFRAHTVIVVAHGGVLGSFLAQIHGVSPNDWRAFPVPNCSITHLEVRADHTAVHALNDVAHLDDLDEVVSPLGQT